MNFRDDPYHILGVTPRAEPEVITAAWKALILKYHPEKHPDNEERATRIHSAYACLTDPIARAAYDQEGAYTPGKVIGNYSILEEIAEGGFGKTYKARHLIADELVCIKHCSRISVLSEATLIEEAKAVWDLRHYSLPTMRDLLRLEDNSLALVMSYIPGPTLFEIIKDVGPLDPETVAWMMERVLNALSYIHRHGVIHGDIKPQNIIIQPETHTAVLVDFGLSVIKPTSSSKSKGYTEYFAPPEEINGMPLVPESDLYSLGMTMIFALTGDLDLVKARRIPGHLSDEFSGLLRRFVTKDVRNRTHWEKEDILGTIRAIRLASFGRAHSGMKPIKGR